jgi:hypothetical protein
VVSRRRDVPAEIRRSVELWIGCVAGALHEDDFKAKLANAGFENIDIEVVREYRSADARQFLSEAGLDADAIAPIVDGAFGSAFVRATKPLVS